MPSLPALRLCVVTLFSTHSKSNTCVLDTSISPQIFAPRLLSAHAPRIIIPKVHQKAADSLSWRPPFPRHNAVKRSTSVDSGSTSSPFFHLLPSFLLQLTPSTSHMFSFHNLHSFIKYNNCTTLQHGSNCFNHSLTHPIPYDAYVFTLTFPRTSSPTFTSPACPTQLFFQKKKKNQKKIKTRNQKKRTVAAAQGPR